MAYPMYGNNNQYYMQSLQDMRDKIDSQMKQYQQSQMQMQQQPVPQIHQNFQLAPQLNNELECKYVENLDDVKNTFVMKIGIFINKDYSTVWIKDNSGNIRTFKTEEIIEIDPRDKEITELKKEIENMRGLLNNATELYNSNNAEQLENKKSTGVQPSKRTNAK